MRFNLQPSVRALTALVFACIAIGLPAAAQSLAGLAALNGTVQDSSGAVVADAVVTISNSSLGIDRKTISNTDGYFVAPSLPPAVGYEVTVKKHGFVAFTRKTFNCWLGRTLPFLFN